MKLATKVILQSPVSNTPVVKANPHIKSIVKINPVKVNAPLVIQQIPVKDNATVVIQPQHDWNRAVKYYKEWKSG